MTKKQKRTLPKSSVVSRRPTLTKIVYVGPDVTMGGVSK